MFTYISRQPWDHSTLAGRSRDIGPSPSALFTEVLYTGADALSMQIAPSATSCPGKVIFASHPCAGLQDRQVAWVLQNYSHTNAVPVSELLQHLQQEVQVSPLPPWSTVSPLVCRALRLA